MSCEDANRRISVRAARPLLSNPMVTIQTVLGATDNEGKSVDPVRIFFDTGNGSWFIPVFRFVQLVNRGEMTVSGNLHGEQITGPSWMIHAKTFHKSRVGSGSPNDRCSGHDHDVEITRAMVAEIVTKIQEARDEFRDIFGNEWNKEWMKVSPLPQRADLTLIELGLRVANEALTREEIVKLLSCPCSRSDEDEFEEDVVAANEEAEENDDEDECEDEVPEDDARRDDEETSSPTVISPAPVLEVPASDVVDDEDAENIAFWREKDTERRATEAVASAQPPHDHPPLCECPLCYPEADREPID